MLHFRHYLHGGCFHFFLHGGKLVTIGTLAICAFSKKDTCTEKNVLHFQCNSEHTCLMCVSTVLTKCICLSWPGKTLMEEILQEEGGILL